MFQTSLLLYAPFAAFTPTSPDWALGIRILAIVPGVLSFARPRGDGTRRSGRCYRRCGQKGLILELRRRGTWLQQTAHTRYRWRLRWFLLLGLPRG
jgi:hypothetical protein